MNFIERRKEILKLRKERYTLKELGLRFGVSYKRIGQIINRPGVQYKVCFICKKLGQVRRLVCKECLGTYFLRDTGSYLEGRDYIREIVRIRDNHTCQKCFKKWEEGKRRFDIHHLNGLCGKKSQSYDCFEEMDGLITLCHKCHLNLDEVREKRSNRSSPRPNKLLPINL